MTKDGQFRVIAVRMVETCAETARRQEVPAHLLKSQAELSCLGVLVRETMQPGNRVQVMLRDSAGNRFVADALPDGTNRSIVNLFDRESDASTDASDGLLRVNYTLRNGDLHQGIVALDADADVSAALMQYLQQSEQIVAFVSIRASSGADSNQVAGFVVQVTPEATHEGLAAMTEHLAGFDDLQTWNAGAPPDPCSLIEQLLANQEYAILAESPLAFGCTCSRKRMLLGLSTLPTSDIRELIEEGECIEVSCDACGQLYKLSPGELAGLADKKGTSDSEILPN